MNVDIELISGCRNKLHISIPKERLDSVKKDVVAKIGKDNQIKGFRKGKAPAAIVEKTFAKKIHDETIQKATYDAYQEVIKEKDIKVFDLICFSDLDEKEDGTTSFVVEYDAMPTFDIPKYEGIPVDDKVTETTDEVVEKEIAQIKKNFATLKDLTADDVLANDDMACISYKATCDGVELSEKVQDAGIYATRDVSWCTVGSQYFMIPGMSDELRGKKIGEEGVLTVDFPADFKKESLAGLKVDYAWKVDKASRSIEPEFTDEFVKEKLNQESVDAFTKFLRERIEERNKKMDETRKMGQIYKYLSKSVEMILPEKALNENTEQHLQTMIRNGMSQGTSKEQIEEQKEKLTQEARNAASEQMRASFVLDAICEKEQITLSNEEFAKYLNEKFMEYRITQEVADSIMKDRAKVASLHSEARATKVLKTLLEKAIPTAGFEA